MEFELSFPPQFSVTTPYKWLSMLCNRPASNIQPKLEDTMLTAVTPCHFLRMIALCNCACSHDGDRSLVEITNLPTRRLVVNLLQVLLL